MIFRPAAVLLCVACLALSIGSPGVAAAEEDSTVEMARQRFREGVSFYDQRQYEKARLAFLQAYALKPHPSILMNLAQSELHGGRFPDAAAHFTEYLRGNTEGTDAEKQQEAEAGLNVAKSKVAEVTITTDSPGAQISVDSEEKGTAPLALPLYLAPGAHTIEARFNERHVAKPFNAAPGQATTLNLALRAAATGTPPPAPDGTGEAAPAAPIAEEPPAASSSEHPAEAPRAVNTETSSAGRRQFFTWWMDSPIAITATIVGVVGLGTGVTFAVLSKREYNNANSIKSTIQGAWETPNGNAPADSAQFLDKNGQETAAPCQLDQQPTALAKLGAQRVGQYDAACTKFGNAKDAGDSKRTVAIVGTVIGSVALVGTVVYYFVDPHAEEKAAAREGFRARLVPWTSNAGSGLSLVGQF
jgi:tetratricopeptide (TPR) repeat protein